ncbi:bifunctional diaminohydroxyphosphoribosylaminopyrimidine deaminase/5-amino-6-(5-phosphoribosylamino)uracil reductase RibD [Neolewinella lacunae]|uniref:Riboflavin biosynthesis protein RibD n=1 Tax=Neolewinella lacunae TaxID=1517758 RepID=A0A923T748_9BACT|nr:bifunctional diaminohydroxyphosphoribosylaminopyrimidine deaminase/5-amino-6-(5-phosphoribosylamino)uracil reductase RibD [Neolewinella lacunae]MBC6993236.1 bifunctional diaminohydroxyphosphoribosylaminopyrimidine deaminase/5-amino-6-(5-phosphoribosylamino)uracil reductase RibD [Neolewinella lacunae]MDN3635717.1 bifunctional diaminohydroxyphosphoribosylaminopyrimidine deaminase/5-amino-6-(5-phosphoribosylamino)uracil reductase RibD [Neolewinella lacunae]
MTDQDYLLRCAQLAELADARVRDNPRVGAVLVHADRIIGEGYHQRAGEAHAEVNCLASVRPADRPLIPASTLYISLEPCYVTGRTGACVDVIRREKIPTVVFAQRDTTTGAGGQSVALLREAGITVREYPAFAPTLAPNAHRRVFTQLGRPFVLLKFAQSADGFLRPANRQQKYWLTNPISRRLVHRWRANTSAILVGGRTVVEDDPALTTRLFPGPHPQPVIVDPRDRTTGRERIFRGEGPSPLLFSGLPRPSLEVTQYAIGPDLSTGALAQVLGKLYERGFGHVTVEGGSALLQAFCTAGCWDEARVFTTPHRFGTGLPAPQLPASAAALRHEWIGSDLLTVFTPG